MDVIKTIERLDATFIGRVKDIRTTSNRRLRRYPAFWWLDLCKGASGVWLELVAECERTNPGKQDYGVWGSFAAC